MAPVREHDQQEGEKEEEEEEEGAPARHPSPPPDELFDISTAVDPCYIISLIRKLVPNDVGDNNNLKSSRVGEYPVIPAEETIPSQSRDQAMGPLNGSYEDMDVVDDLHSLDSNARDVDLCSALVGEEVWEECGCILWDLAANKTHAELMVQHLVLEVLLANLIISQSGRVTEICLGIIGNLTCHDGLMKNVVSTNGLIETIIAQLFLDDTRCLCEACRVLISGLQGSESNAWAKAIQSEHILGRILWIAENSLNPQLLEKCVGLLLSLLENQQEVSCHLLSLLTKLGLPTLLINLLAFEISRLTSERVPERYCVLDVILRAMEAISTIDGFSNEICSDKKLFELVTLIIKLPDKSEVSDSCVTAAVLVANMLSDVPDLASEISHDMSFLQGLLDIFHFASGDMEARSALWSIIAASMLHVKKIKMSLSSLRQYVLVLGSKCEMIEDDLLDWQSSNTCKDSTSSSKSVLSNARNKAVRCIVDVLSQWDASKDGLKSDSATEEHFTDATANITRLFDVCVKHIEFCDRIQDNREADGC